MEDKKYVLTDYSMNYHGHILYRIKAVKDFGDVRKGTLGGYVESESNLSHLGCCWIYDNAKVYGKAQVLNDAKIFHNARIFGDAVIYDYVYICNNVKVYGKAAIFGHAQIFGDAQVFGDAIVRDRAVIYDYAKVYGHAFIRDCQIGCNAKVFGKTQVFNDASILGDSKVYGKVRVCNNAYICDAEIKSEKDYAVYKNTWSSGRYFTWTKSNNMWKVGCFYGTGEELIAKAYKDSEKNGKCYEIIVKAQEALLNVK